MLAYSHRRRAHGACIFVLAASAAVLAPCASAHDFCVADAAGLQQALAAVSDGGAFVDEDSTIRVVAGSYATGAATGDAPFTSVAMRTTHALAIEGGYDAGCTQRAFPAAATVLDGQEATGVMVLGRPNGALAVSHLTFTRGNADVGAGLQVNYDLSPARPVSIDHVIVRDNHASGMSAGGLYAVGSAPAANAVAVLLDASLISGNSGRSGGGAYVMANQGVAAVTFTTIVGNSSTVNGDGLLCAHGPGSTCYLRGVVAWGNDTSSVHFISYRDNIGVCNDIDLRTGYPFYGEADNRSVDPGFVGPANGDYHLRGDSPLLRACPWPAYGATDLDDRPYPSSGLADPSFGAYGDTVFADGSEP
ncbi:hypothetical protein [Dokdonella fugitiva]|jgi:hypothetical protein|uniref:hypothetical protein n=1 Tax=Dokdonella fugitiva TaxID=328517 RepID=UPI0015FC32A5|nr:hypothetical protein [Dokdonella fugitiva]MBA8884469.1 hypothetical protein [Dokdonella fugitiva]